MKNFKYIWLAGLLITALIVIVPLLLLVTPEAETADDPQSKLPDHPTHTDHTDLMNGPFETGSDVTKACLSCHKDAAHDLMQTTHWTWKAEPVSVMWSDEPVATGKANVLNNFCIGIQSNWTGCTKCHAGYGWSDANFDFSQEQNVDCLVCHEQTHTYVKDNSGIPFEEVDLVAVAQSVGLPTRQNCGYCHFNGGGGNAVKHGDMDESLYFPNEQIDVHMGRLDFQCIDCHRTEDHQIKGRSISVSVDTANQVQCVDCHEEDVHDDQRINEHVDTVACQTCHVPLGAVREPTKMEWDWSTAGQDREDNPHEYLKIKGSFIYESQFIPEYDWYNGSLDDRYLIGDTIDPTQTTVLNPPAGSIDDPTAKIWPFKIHQAKQIYDTVYNYLLQPKTVGEYWVNFDWDEAARLGSEAVGLEYSGKYDFAPTEMYWPLSHMVQPAANALQCNECHGENGRLDWEALGYYGDPMTWGGRDAD
ncbi:MAG TPA: tetrathionate reductase family octaheme c-type cytochrome [Aggregatilineaceae bacterium]|nr:tetrathionate reductase family octaheme c-type cytochrome [Aggregatilineaceae bacterium]